MDRRSSYPMQSAPIPSSSPVKLPEPSTPTTSTPRLPKYIPATDSGEPPKGRTLIICLDGTGDKFDGDNSNIVHLVSCLKKDDPRQITYYQTGIGTYNSGGLSNGIAAAVDMAIGSGLGVHVRDAYRFLMQTYREGDKICLFGFSRGAYTARCLAGMLHKVGLLPAHNVAQIPFAYKFYKDDTQKGWDMSSDFKRTFCIDINVHFVGVFDSVASVGLIPRKLPLSSTPTKKPSYFRHAMALDERRSKFKICRYQQKDHTDPDSKWVTKAATQDSLEKPRQRLESTSTANTFTDPFEKESRQDSAASSKPVREVDCLEVWFSGCHADIGGGAVANEARHKPSQIPLRWMIRQCFECNTNIIFNTHRLAEEGLDVHMLYPTYHRLEKPIVGPSPNTMERYHQGSLAPISRRSTLLEAADEKSDLYTLNLPSITQNPDSASHWMPEQIEDYFDAIAPLNDQLIQAKFWWILEVWPIKVRIQEKENDAWVKKVRMNLGRYRVVQETEPQLHWTVQQRMVETGYKPQVRMGRGAAWRFVV